MEKLALALVNAVRKLRHYFHAHTIKVLTEHPLRAILQKADLSRRMVKWAIELDKHDIRIVPRCNASISNTEISVKVPEVGATSRKI